METLKVSTRQTNLICTTMETLNTQIIKDFQKNIIMERFSIPDTNSAKKDSLIGKQTQLQLVLNSQ